MYSPCLSAIPADHPLRPATRRCLGEPLPHQLADRPRDPPRAINLLDLTLFESLILAQDERWRRALSMQVERFQ